MTTGHGPRMVLAVLGGGQLGRYLAAAAVPRGIRVLVWDPSHEAPAAGIAWAAESRPFDDPEAARDVAALADLATWEFENVDPHALRRLEEAGCPVHPRPEVHAVSSDRILEKRRVSLFAPVAPYAVVPGGLAGPDALTLVGQGPCILKTARSGYDGKGQFRIDCVEGLGAALAEIESRDAVLERVVDFEHEVSVVVARSLHDGAMVHFPPFLNRHCSGILDVTICPAPIDPDAAGACVRIARGIAEGLDVRGLLTVEFFVCRDGAVIVNEIAPRPHNSGHCTLDGFRQSQFDLHLQALLDPMLQTPEPTEKACAMANLLGELWAGGEPRWEQALGPSIRIHHYGKGDARPGRKMGHINAWARTPQDAVQAALNARESLRVP